MDHTDERDPSDADGGRPGEVHRGPPARAAQLARDQRLATEMRANLKKRKQQARARRATEVERTS